LCLNYKTTGLAFFAGLNTIPTWRHFVWYEYFLKPSTAKIGRKFESCPSSVSIPFFEGRNLPSYKNEERRYGKKHPEIGTNFRASMYAGTKDADDRAKLNLIGPVENIYFHIINVLLNMLKISPLIN
jgi:hypothetical protein